MATHRFCVLASIFLTLVLVLPSCILHVCDEDERHCDEEDAGLYWRCVGGEWFHQACEEGRFCSDGACVHCVEGAQRCSVHWAGIQKCVDGLWVDALCESGEHCVDGACVLKVEPCLVSERTCSDISTICHCVAGELPIFEACEYQHKCDAGTCLRAESCVNGRLDEGELAVDCGGICTPCEPCARDEECLETGFCDSALNYLCSKPCRDDSDCARHEDWDGEFCRLDGRCSSKVFSTVWEVSADNLEVYLPFDTDYPDAKCDFRILWGDEPASVDILDQPRVTNCLLPQNRHHVYANAGRYEVKIVGTYDGWGRYYRVVNHDSESAKYAPKLIELRSFGPVGLGHDAFKDCSQLVAMPLRDVPDATKLLSLEHAFFRATAFDAPIGHWDTRHVSSLKHAFSAATSFNQAIGQWDVSQVSDMAFAFSGATSFNQALNAWDTSNVTSMFETFRAATSFNQKLGAWNTGKVTDMGGVFYSASSFDQPLAHWDTSAVQNMSFLFSGARSFDQVLGAWNTGKVTDMSAMFKDAESFDQAIGAWDTSRVERMGFMFSGARRFNQPLDAWSTQQVTSMESMFSNARCFSQPLASWSTEGVLDMKKMFLDAVAFDQDLTSWSLSESVELLDIFQGSGMGPVNVCALLGSSSAWKSQIDKLGVIFDCP